MQFDRTEPTPENGFRADSAALIAHSYRILTGRELIEAGDEPWTGSDHALRLYEAPFVVLAHEAAGDPVFFYANLAAQRLFELPWADLVRLPSRFSAEPLAREERQRLLDRVTARGYIDDYSGIRIASSGRRFRISEATVWNLLDPEGRVAGQAATFSAWTFLDGEES